MTVPKTYDSQRVLIVDDEIEHLQFFVDYMRTKGLTVDTAVNAGEALKKSEDLKYRAYFIDLNIPLGDTTLPLDAPASYYSYKGLYVIQRIRSQGNSGIRVVAYSAHYNDEIQSEMSRLYSTYIVKGRVRDLKDTVAEILRVDPYQRN